MTINSIPLKSRLKKRTFYLLCSSRNTASGIETARKSSPIGALNDTLLFNEISPLVHSISKEMGCVESLKFTPKMTFLFSVGIKEAIGGNSCTEILFPRF